MEKDLSKCFLDEIFTQPPKSNYLMNKIVPYHIDEMWSFDSMYMKRTYHNRGYRYILVVIDNFSQLTWCIPLRNHYSQTKKDGFSKLLIT